MMIIVTTIIVRTRFFIPSFGIWKNPRGRGSARGGGEFSHETRKINYRKNSTRGGGGGGPGRFQVFPQNPKYVIFEILRGARRKFLDFTLREQTNLKVKKMDFPNFIILVCAQVCAQTWYSNIIFKIRLN